MYWAGGKRKSWVPLRKLVSRGEQQALGVATQAESDFRRSCDSRVQLLRESTEARMRASQLAALFLVAVVCAQGAIASDLSVVLQQQPASGAPRQRLLSSDRL